MSNKLRGPFLYDNLDVPNIPTQSPQSPRSAWQSTAIQAGTLLVILFSFTAVLYFIFKKLEAIAADGFNKFADLLTWVILCAPILTVGLLIWHGHWFLRAITKKQALINILDKQVSVDDVSLLRTLLAPGYFDVVKTRAVQSQFQGIQTLTYDASRTTTNTQEQQQPILPTEEELIEMLPEGNKPLLIELKEQGIINRSNHSIFLGFRKEQ